MLPINNISRPQFYIILKKEAFLTLFFKKWIDSTFRFKKGNYIY